MAAAAAVRGEMSAYDVRCQLEAGLLTTRAKSGCQAWQRFVEVVDDSGRPQGFVMCTAGCAALLRYSGRRTGTSHLNRHRCTSSPSVVAPPPQAPREGERLCRLAARWLARELLPARVLDSLEFRELARALAVAEASSLSPTNVAALMRDVTVEEKGKFAGELSAALCGTGAGLNVATWHVEDQLHAAVLLSFVDRGWTLRREMAAFQVDSTSELVSACFTELSLEASLSSSSLLVAVGEIPTEGVRHNLRCGAAMLEEALRRPLSAHPAAICRAVLDYVAEVGLEEFANEPLPDPDVSSSIDAVFYVHRNYALLAPVVPQLSSLGEDTLRGVATILEPFQQALRDWSAESHPTLNLVVLWYYKLLKHCRAKVLEDSPMEGEFRASLARNLEESFEIHDLHKVATFLWPQFRTMKMLPETEQEAVCELVYSLVNPSGGQPPSPARSNNAQRSAKRRRTTFSEWEECEEELREGADEVEKYVDFKCSAVEESGLLQWWRNHEEHFPELSKLARAILAVPATATACLPAWQRRHLALLRSYELEPYLFLHHHLRAARDFVPPTPKTKRKNDASEVSKHKSKHDGATKFKEEQKP